MPPCRLISVTKPQAVITVATGRKSRTIAWLHQGYKTASGNHCCNALTRFQYQSYALGYKTASGNHCCNFEIYVDTTDNSPIVTKPQAVITVATHLRYRLLNILRVTKPQAVITVATAPLETLVQSGSFGVLWQTKSTFTNFFSKKRLFQRLSPTPGSQNPYHARTS